MAEWAVELNVVELGFVEKPMDVKQLVAARAHDPDFFWSSNFFYVLHGLPPLFPFFEANRT